MEGDCHVIEIESRPRRKFISFEEAVVIPILEELPMSTSLLRHFGIIHTHWAVKVFYYPVFAIILYCVLTLDVAYMIFRYLLPWLCKKVVGPILSGLWDLLKWIGKSIWTILGDAIKAFLVKLLKLVAIALVIYLAYAFLVTGGYKKMLQPVSQLWEQKK